MAYEIELANILHDHSIIASTIVETFEQNDNILPLVSIQVFPDSTNVARFGKIDMSGTGQANGESTSYTFGAADEREAAEVVCTGAQTDSAEKISIMASRFGNPLADVEYAIKRNMLKLMRLLASEFKTLASSVSGSAGTTNTTLTVDTILDGRYVINSGMNGNMEGMLTFIGDYKGNHELRKVIANSQASAYVSKVELGILGIATAGEPEAVMFDTQFFSTSGLPTANVGVDDVGILFDRRAFCCGIDGISGFQTFLTNPSSQNKFYELYQTAFWEIKEYNDAAACRIISKT